jgi:hypothetical protein
MADSYTVSAWRSVHSETSSSRMSERGSETVVTTLTRTFDLPVFNNVDEHAALQVDLIRWTAAPDLHEIDPSDPLTWDSEPENQPMRLWRGRTESLDGQAFRWVESLEDTTGNDCRQLAASSSTARAREMPFYLPGSSSDHVRKLILKLATPPPEPNAITTISLLQS